MYIRVFKLNFEEELYYSHDHQINVQQSYIKLAIKTSICIRLFLNERIYFSIFTKLPTINELKNFRFKTVTSIHSISALLDRASIINVTQMYENSIYRVSNILQTNTNTRCYAFAFVLFNHQMH